MKGKLFLCVVATLLILSAPGFADSQKEVPLNKKTPIPSWVKDNKNPPTANFVWPLISLMALFLGLLYLTKRFASSEKATHPQELSILAEVPLGGQKKLALVQAREKCFVVAITREKIEFLTEVGTGPESNFLSKKTLVGPAPIRVAENAINVVENAIKN